MKTTSFTVLGITIPSAFLNKGLLVRMCSCNINDNKFCPECGKPLETIKYKTSVPSAFDLKNDLETLQEQEYKDLFVPYANPLLRVVYVYPRIGQEHLPYVPEEVVVGALLSKQTITSGQVIVRYSYKLSEDHRHLYCDIIHNDGKRKAIRDEIIRQLDLVHIPNVSNVLGSLKIHTVLINCE